MDLLLCRKNIHMKIAPAKRYKCYKCGESVGITQATLEAIEDVEDNLNPICLECYKKHHKDDIRIVHPTNNQIKEMTDYENNL